MVTVRMVLEDGRTIHTPRMTRWLADWWVVNVLAPGHWIGGHRVVRAKIRPLHH